VLRNVCLVSLLFLATLSLSSCSSGLPARAPATVSALSVFSTTTYTGTVLMPAGSNVKPDKLTVVDSVSSAVPARSGSFTISAYDNGTVIVIALSPAGNPMMMGWLDATHNTISADTTAQVLAFFALGGQQLLNDSDRTEYMTQISTLSSFPTLSQAVAAEIAANPDCFSKTDSKVKTALNTFFTAITSVVPQERRGSVSANDVIATPGASSPQSGVTVLDDPPASAHMTNSYRRRTHAFVLRQSDTLGKKITPDPGAITDFDIPPTVGVAGGVTGAISDIFNAYFGNQPTAYAPQSTATFAIPLTSGYDKTTYQILNLGPGGQGQSLISSLTGAQHLALVQVSVAGFVTDSLLPFFSNLALGSGFLPDTTRLPSATQAAFKKAFISDLETDLIGFLATVPGEQDKLIAGNYKDVMVDLLQDAVASNTVRGLFIEAEQQAATQLAAGTLSTAAVTTAMQKFNVIMNAAGGVLQVFDTGIYSAQLLSSDVVDQWAVVTNNTKVTLSPASTTINAGEQVTLTAAAPGTDLTAAVYSFYWSTNSTAGSLTEVGGGGRTNQTAYCSSSAQSTFVASANVTSSTSGSVTVQVSAGASCPINNILGIADATVTVAPSTPGYIISGANGGTFDVDDDLTVKLDGVQIYSDGTVISGTRNPFTFQAKVGQTLNFTVEDTYGFCSSMSALYLSCSGSSTYTLVDPGFDLGCGRPGGDQGQVHNLSYVIPANICPAVPLASKRGRN
ncbi:MAG: hypothetical protein ABI064_07165, partial [Acidobacteriaceae bacterium]